MAKAPGSGSYLRAAAVCPPGLEEICAREMTDLGLRPKPAGSGVLEFDANHRQLYAANVWLRTAGRVLVRVATFRATDFVHLQDRAAAIDWSRWVEPGRAPAFRITTSDSKLYHTKAIAQRLHQVSLPPSIGEPEQLFIVRIHRNTVTISADSSGQALHRRPWRTQLGEAPLRPTMAAACLLAAQWDRASSLVDPFCGAGTFPVEAALMAAGLPPGGEREFAFHTWPTFDTGAWASVAGSVKAAYEAVTADAATVPAIVGYDRDPAMVEAARANAERAEVARFVTLDQRVVSHLPGRSDAGLVITNPPYGKRLGSGGLENLYRRLGAVTSERLPNHALAVVTAHRKLANSADGRTKPVLSVRHGGMAVKLHYRPAAPTPPAESDSASDQDEPVTAATEQGEAPVG